MARTSASLRARTVLEVPPSSVVALAEQTLGLSSAELAQALGVTERTVARWSAGLHPQVETRGRLIDLLGLIRHLRDTFDDDPTCAAWMRAPNRYLGLLAPSDAVRAGRIDRVEAALEALDSGVFV
jgi:hypothetical protein